MLYNIIKLTTYILLLLYINYIGTIVYNPKNKLTKKQIISMLVLSILLLLINTYFEKIYIIFLFYILCIIYYKINYKNNIHLSLYSTLITLITIFISQSIVTSIINASIINNFLIIILSFLITRILQKQIKILVHSTQNIVLINYLLLNFYLIYIIIKSIIQKQLLQHAIIFIILTTFLTILIIKEQKLEKLKRENKELQKNVKTADQTITGYRKASHEYKNKLIIIESMINPKDKELKKYIDYLINESIIIKNKWLNDLKFIPFPIIKNFVNYKINVLEHNNAKIELFIGEELEKINSEKVSIIDINNINTIIGIMLDNMIESIENTKEKLVSINAYMDKDVIHILFANNFENNIDLIKINKLGYSTKGHQRGVGLSLVTDIIKSGKNLELETKIEENFFIQHLKIKNIGKYLK